MVSAVLGVFHYHCLILILINLSLHKYLPKIINSKSRIEGEVFSVNRVATTLLSLSVS